MWLQSILCVLLATLVVIITTKLLVIVVRNRRAHQFFKKRSNLPTLPNPGIFDGHVAEVVWVKRNWQQSKKLHAMYGPTFGMYYIYKPSVSTIDPDLIKKVVLDNPNDNIIRAKADSLMEEFENDSILLGDDEHQWRRLRAAIAPAFTKTKIMSSSVQSEITSTINKVINLFETKLAEAESERSQEFFKLDVDELFLRYTIGLVFTCFYRQDKVIRFDTKVDLITRTVDRACREFLNPAYKFCNMFPAFIPVVNWLIMRFHPLGIMRKQIMSYVKQQASINLRMRQQMEERRTTSSTKGGGDGQSLDSGDFVFKDGTRFRRNMMDYVIDQFHEGKLSKSEFLNNSFNLLLAAAKTSADALSKLVYNLAAHPEEQEKLRSSVLVDGPDSEYLHWSINESMRLFPPAPWGSMRTVSRDVTTKEGFLIPAGTLVQTPANLIHRLPEYWGPDADEFRPERWRNSGNFHPAQFLAFGLGKRTCLGKEFAMREMKMLMTELLSRYRFKCAPETNEKTIMEFDTFFVLTNSDNPINIEIRRI